MSYFSSFLSVITNFGYVVLINVSYYMVYCYTKVEIYARPKYKFLKNTFLKQSSTPRLIECEYINDGVVSISSVAPYDFIIYSDFLNCSAPTVKVIKHTPLPEGEKLRYELSDEKFIMVELTVKNATTSIKFSTDEYNYYVVGNPIHQQFVKYFIKRHYAEFLTTNSVTLHDLNNYRLKIIDSNVTVQEFDEKCTVWIEKSGYRLRSL